MFNVTQDLNNEWKLVILFKDFIMKIEILIKIGNNLSKILSYIYSNLTIYIDGLDSL